MMKSTAANVTFVGLVVFGLLAIPSPSVAGPFDWLCPSNWGNSSSQQATTYAPPYSPTPSTATPAFVSYGATSGCNTCATPAAACGTCVSRTCAYTPQTTYRWTYSRVNRLTYQPVVGCDPCSGQRTTYYRAVQTKTLLPWLHQTPVTTYRLACSPTLGSVGWSACNTCTTGWVSPGSGSSCVTCVGGSSATTADEWRADPSYPPRSTYANPPGPIDAEPTEVRKPAASVEDLQPEPDPSIDPASTRTPGLNAPAGPSGTMAIRSAAPESGYRTVSYEAPAPMTPFGPDARRRMEENFRRASGK